MILVIILVGIISVGKFSIVNVLLGYEVFDIGVEYGIIIKVN